MKNTQKVIQGHFHHKRYNCMTCTYIAHIIIQAPTYVLHYIVGLRTLHSWTIPLHDRNEVHHSIVYVCACIDMVSIVIGSVGR